MRGRAGLLLMLAMLGVAAGLYVLGPRIDRFVSPADYRRFERGDE
jgi:hypothetical protein